MELGEIEHFGTFIVYFFSVILVQQRSSLAVIMGDLNYGKQSLIFQFGIYLDVFSPRYGFPKAFSTSYWLT